MVTADGGKSASFRVWRVLFRVLSEALEERLTTGTLVGPWKRSRSWV
jgi:hypothetical protein